MSSFIQRMKKMLIDNTLLRSSKSTQVFSILDAWSALISMAQQNSSVKGCLMQIRRQGDHFLIRMLAFTQRGEPVYQSGDTVLGHVLVAYNLEENVRAALKQDGEVRLLVEQLMPSASKNYDNEDE